MVEHHRIVVWQILLVLSTVHVIILPNMLVLQVCQLPILLELVDDHQLGHVRVNLAEQLILVVVGQMPHVQLMEYVDEYLILVLLVLLMDILLVHVDDLKLGHV